MSAETLLLIVPESILVVGGVLLYLGGAFAPEARRLWTAVAWLTVLGAAAALASQYCNLHLRPEVGVPLLSVTEILVPRLSVAVEGPLAVDLLGQFIRWLALMAGGLLILLAGRTHQRGPAAEYLGTLLMLTAGVMLTAAARTLVLMFVGLELISIPTYVLLYLSRKDQASQESTFKYFFLSLLSSALLLYGMSFLYGIGGSVELSAIRAALASPELLAAGGTQLLARVALVLLFVGIGFRITAVPFHFYAPDVYQGTTNLGAALLSVVPKLAGFVVLARLVMWTMPGMEPLVWRVTLVLSIATMTLGNVLALWQDNLRRLMAYSSIAHAGYMLIGVSATMASATLGEAGVMTFDGLAGVLLYLAVYSVAAIGAFGVLVALGSSTDGAAGREINTLGELAGVGRTRPLLGAALALFMFSLAGIPPLAGFWAKFSLFASAIDLWGSVEQGPLADWFIVLVVVGALNAAIAAGYYLRVVATLYFQAPEQPESQPAGQSGERPLLASLAVALCVVGVVGVGLFPRPVMQAATAAADSLYVGEPVAPAGNPVAPAATKAEPVSNPAAAAAETANAEAPRSVGAVAQAVDR